ncbi:MAG: GNAT family N-acetyltransferase [Prevotellaceae bacterium]|nr:GNAT family N-acetyltransferase [Candidatus Faecinaster equi]
MNIEYKIYKPGELNADLIYDFLVDKDDYLVPTLSSRVDLHWYAERISLLATHIAVFVMGGGKMQIVGLISFYANKTPQYSYTTYLCVDQQYQKLLVGLNLMTQALEYCKRYESKGFHVSLNKMNKPLVEFYKRFGLREVGETPYPNSTLMQLHLEMDFE